MDESAQDLCNCDSNYYYHCMVVVNGSFDTKLGLYFVNMKNGISKCIFLNLQCHCEFKYGLFVWFVLFDGFKESFSVCFFISLFFEKQF